MKSIGIIGCTYEATALFYRLLCARSQVLIGPNCNPDILLHTRNFDQYLVDEESREQIWTDLMLDSISRLKRAGAEVIVCPANSNHLVYAQVSSKAELPWLNIVEVVFDAVRSSSSKKLGLLGTNFTVESGIYSDSERDIFLLPKDLQAALHSCITTELIHGVVSEQSRQVYKNCIDYFVKENIDACILGCTELTLFHELDTGLKLFDSTQLLVEAAIEMSIA